MMSDSWQLWLSLACVAGAAWQLGLRIWRHFDGTSTSGSCGGGCSTCPSGGEKSVPELIQLEMKP
jgi:hypothetical protein